jgi:MFS family permease
MWIIVLIGLVFGAVDVLVPLRLDALGASGVAIGATFIVAALAEARITPLMGRVSDRRGRFVPLRAGLILTGIVVILLSLPESPWVLSLVLVATAPAVGFMWAPSLAMLSDGAEAAGLDQALGFALVNLAWGFGQAAGAAGGGAAARATSDAVPYAVLSVLCFVTLVLLRRIATPREELVNPAAPASRGP